jgi:GntR family transcriptional repressor for pyruvate dehydrogenase complex
MTFRDGASGVAAPARRFAPPPKAAEVLASDMRAMIIGQGLPAGTRLESESELIERSSLSRATVREALRLLEADGLIRVRRGPHGGITVRHPDPSHISRSLATMVALAQAPLRQLFDFRLAVEPAAAAAAAVAATDEQRELLRQSMKATHDGVPESVDFHVLVGEASGNALYHMILAALHDVLQWHVELEALSADKWGQTHKAHTRIARAIIDGDARRAESTMRRHLEVFRAHMDESGRLDAPIIPRSAWRPNGRSDSGTFFRV